MVKKTNLRVAPEDIVIVYNSEKDKNVLARILSIDKDNHLDLQLADETAAFDSTEERFSAPFTSILAALGPEPRCYGTTYGIPVHPFYERTSVKGWGEIAWMFPATDKMVEDTHKELLEFIDGIKEDRLHRFAYLTKMHRNDPGQKGKIKGWYIYAPKKESDTIVYNIDDIYTLTRATIAHEYAHGLWDRIMSDSKRADWIELYHSCVMVEASGDNAIKSVLVDFASLKGKGAIRELMGEYKKDGAAASLVSAKAVIKAIKEEHCLDRHDLDALLTANRSISKYIPNIRDVRKGVAVTEVSDYAGKSSAEFWAECFSAFYNNDTSRDALPDLIYDEMLVTLKTLQASR